MENDNFQNFIMELFTWYFPEKAASESYKKQLKLPKQEQPPIENAWITKNM